MSNVLGRIWANTDSITKWIQVVALVVAAYWAYTRFFIVEAPSLQPTAHLTFDELRCNEEGNTCSSAANACRIKIAVTVKNDGRSSFDVGRVQIRAWRSDKPQPTAQAPAYFDVDKMEHGTPVLNSDPPPDLFLNRHYPPGSQYDQSFSWEFARLDGVYVFRVDAYNDQKKLLSNVRVWRELVCGH
jgi:hypothetical protein